MVDAVLSVAAGAVGVLPHVSVQRPERVDPALPLQLGEPGRRPVQLERPASEDGDAVRRASRLRRRHVLEPGRDQGCEQRRARRGPVLRQRDDVGPERRRAPPPSAPARAPPPPWRTFQLTIRIESSSSRNETRPSLVVRMMAIDAAERDLVAGARRGDAAAVEGLFRRHWADAFRAAYAVTGSRAAAEDVAQEAFLKALDRLDRFDGRRPFGAWLHRIAVNRAIDEVRSGRRVRRPRRGARARDLARRAVAVAPAIVAELGRLPLERRLPIVLRHWLGLSVEETAELLGVPVGTVALPGEPGPRRPARAAGGGAWPLISSSCWPRPGSTSPGRRPRWRSGRCASCSPCGRRRARPGAPERRGAAEHPAPPGHRAGARRAHPARRGEPGRPRPQGRVAPVRAGRGAAGRGDRREQRRREHRSSPGSCRRRAPAPWPTPPAASASPSAAGRSAAAARQMLGQSARPVHR